MADRWVMTVPETGRTRMAPEDFVVRDRERLLAQGLLVEDGRRTRSSFFDGRFLTARDLTREQTYVLSRMADLGRAAGTGVVTGLTVVATGSRALRVAAGYGIAGSGELVVLTAGLTVDLSNLAEIERLNAVFGLGRAPNAPPWTLTGAFVVALRPVEYTANPTEAYPTSVTGTRRLEDGDVVEATAVVLFPYPIDLAGGLDRARARIAHDLFIAGRPMPMPAGVLPLAMAGLDGGVVRWVDEFLVRREVGADHGGIRGLGSVDLSLREAFLAQYDRHLQAEGAAAYAASDRFLALPPAGRFPAATVSATSFTQSYFPPSVDVRISIVPDDEVAALVEESLLLPPIDLTRPAAELEGTAVLVLVPTPRWQVRALTARLDSLQRPLQPALNLVAAFRPAFSLNLLLGRQPLPIVTTTDSTTQAWQETLATIAAGGFLWYVRRPNLAPSEEVAGIDLMLVGDTETTRVALDLKLAQLGFVPGGGTGIPRDFQAIVDQSSGDAALAGLVLAFLASVSFDDSPILIAGAIHELARAFEIEVTRDQVLTVWGRYRGAGFGEGVLRLERALPSLHVSLAAVIGQSGRVPDLDRVGRVSTRPVEDLARELVTQSNAGSDAVAEWIDLQLNGGS
jgi:hypothetical protein